MVMTQPFNRSVFGWLAKRGRCNNSSQLLRQGYFHPIEAQQGLFDRVMRTFGLCGEILTESLILAQDERWRRA